MNVLVIGANGQVGKHVVKQLKESEHTSIAMVRKEEQVATMNDLGAGEVVIADLEDDFSHAFKQADAVIFAAGSGGSTGADKTLVIDLWGAIKSFQYAEKASINHFVQLSSIGAGDPDGQPDKIKHYMVAKAVSDQMLMSTSLSYSIVRPGPLTNEEATGKIKVADAFNNVGEDSITRADVATALIDSLTNKATHGKAFEILAGEEEISNALSSLK
ncbi:SDR family oxidoreductase [Alkalihalobacillus sp. LMS6]|uniref:SDR family oxidoreductase n=1 Tax=Alkalihalobacillus sp. LMS6 TaxID=2924034 RepID=UPI0020D12A6B|nr:SDR family oxidoreductase [Alkalihalobacillus sp. LMS6]UTR06227.1 SDR family oxidoreductase [Alkalihalobacillus sp. LMS6]